MGIPVEQTKIRMGLHAANDWTTVPASLKFVAPEPGWTKRNTRERIQRPHEAGDGHRYHSRAGRPVCGISGLSLPVRGIKGGAGDGVSTDVANTMDITAECLEALCGRALTDRTGEKTSSSPGTGTTVVLSAPPANLDAGSAVLVKGATSGKYQLRWVVAVDDDELTICRPLTTDLGVPESPAASSDVFACAHTWMNHATNSHKHLFAEFEDSLDYWRMFGLFGNASLQATAGGILHLSFSDLTGTVYDDDQPSPPLSFVEPDHGGDVPCINVPVWIGDTLYMATGLGFDFGLQPAPRPSDGAPGGHYGFTVPKPPQTTLTMTLHSGTLTTPSEVDAAQRALFEASDNRQDILVQWGRKAGEVFGIRLPDADLEIEEAHENGQKMLNVTARPSRPQGGEPSSTLIAVG